MHLQNSDFNCSNLKELISIKRCCNQFNFEMKKDIPTNDHVQQQIDFQKRQIFLNEIMKTDGQIANQILELRNNLIIKNISFPFLVKFQYDNKNLNNSILSDGYKEAQLKIKNFQKVNYKNKDQLFINNNQFYYIFKKVITLLNRNKKDLRISPIKKDYVQILQISKEFTINLFKFINNKKNSLSQLQVNKQITQLFKNTLNQNENQLLGGGGCCSSQGNFNSFSNNEGTQINNISQHKETEIQHANLEEKNVNCTQKTDEIQASNNLQNLEENKVNCIQKTEEIQANNNLLMIMDHKKQTQQKTDLNLNQKSDDNQIEINLYKKEFEIYNEIWKHKEKIIQSIKNDNQQKVKKGLLKKCIEIKDQIFHDEKQIFIQKEEIQDILETYLLLDITTISQKSNKKKDEFDNLLNEIKQIQVYEMDFPIMELVFYIDILINLNQMELIFDENQQKELKELVIDILNFSKNQGEFSEIQIKESKVKKFICKFENKKEYVGLKYYIDILLKKIDEFGDKFILKSQDILSEILFYVKIFFEIYKQSDQQDYIILTLIRINYLIQKFQNEKANRNKLIYQQFSDHLIQQNIDEFLNQIMQKSDLFINKIFLIFTVENQDYRYITLSILFNINSVFKNKTQNTQNQKYLSDFLTNKYIIEKEQSIRVLFDISADTEFVQNFDQNIKNEEFQQNIIKFDEQRKQMLLPHIEQLQDFERSIHSLDDVIKLITENALQKWERDIQKRQKQNIAQKDDVLLEVKDLYINQMITYLKGNQIFQKQKSIKEPSSSEQNAMQDILQLFLNPNASYKQKFQEKNEKVENEDEQIFKDQSNKCYILAILAEGGTGKSMLIKKLETFLIEKLSKLNTETETGNYLPLLIKCNYLDSKKPSLDDYLKQYGGISMGQIKNLKQNERKKLILLDGYDEYTGDYFEIYKILKLNEWENTKVVVSTRKEKLSQDDACKYFSKQNELGEIDEASYCLVKLEEFTKKDIDEYAQRYFKQERKTDIIEKDLKNLNDCLSKNNEFEKLLHLPINLYLFTRIIVNINENEIENLKNNVSDQIGIQDIFFSNQFEREAQLFIDNHIHSNDLKRDQEFRKSLKNYYFEYFQTIAMTMFENRGVKSNYLQVEKSNINFKIQNFVINNIQESQQLANNLLEKINNYVNSKIVTRSKEEVDMYQKNKEQNTKHLIEFKHKSLFEYFGARAMKYDFDVNGDDIYKLDIEQLKEFKINKKSIMNIGQNQSEQQILLKLYKMIKNEIESPQFISTYYLDQIENNSKYIQYIKKSTIKIIQETSIIDVGASNMLSTLFLSKYMYSYLQLNICSFSKLYVSCQKSDQIKFNFCNLKNSYLKNLKINYDTCNIEKASLDTYQKVFDSQNISSFKQVIWDKKNILYSINESGFINSFKFENQNTYLQKSKQFSEGFLSQILIIDSETLLVSSKFSLFSINSSSFDVLQSHQFKNEIYCVIMIKGNILVTFEYEKAFYGSFKNGFRVMNDRYSRCLYNESKHILIDLFLGKFTLYNKYEDFKYIKSIKGHNTNITSFALSPDGKYLVTGSNYGTCKVWDVDQAFKLIKSIKGDNTNINSIVFSEDGKYLTISSNNGTCKIWQIDKGFKLIKTIKDTKAILYVTYSADGKYLATGSFQNFKIWNAEKGFELINTIQGQTDKVHSVAFSADGKYLATGSEDKTCKIWNAEKGFILINKIQGHTDSIQSVAFSADGKYLATGSKDNTCKIWNAEKCFELINTIQGHTSDINSVAFSADGMQLATGSNDNTCKIWNAEKGFELINTIQGHTHWVTSATFSADGMYLATGSGDNTFKIWNAEKGFELIKTISDCTGRINPVVFSADGKYLATALNQICKIWNAQNGFELINTIQDHTHYVLSVAFSADGKYFATCSFDKTCKIWNAEKDFELINTIQGHTDPVLSVAFSADGKYLATSSEDKTFKIWNAKEGFELNNTNQQSHTFWVKTTAFSADGKYLATGSGDRTCKIWNADKGFELINTIQDHANSVTSVVFSADGKYLATGSWDKTCKIWNAKKGFELINTIQGHSSGINSVAFSTDGKYLATGSEDKTCKIWNAEKDFELINTIQAHTKQVRFVTFVSDGKYLATGSEDKTCKIWNVEKGFELMNTIQDHTSDINSVAFSSDGKYLATGSKDQTCKIWNAEEGFDLINTIQDHNFEINSVAFSADGKYLATSSFNTCKIWKTEIFFELINTIQEQNSNIYSVTFSSDGKYLVTASLDYTCKIWNAKKGFELINAIQFHTSKVNSFAFSPDRKYLAANSSDNICKIWNVEKGFELINIIQGYTLEKNTVTFSQDGKYICLKQNVQSYDIYDLQTLKLIENQKDYLKLQKKYSLQQSLNEQIINQRIFELMYNL